MTEVYVPLADLARDLGMDRSNTRKYVLKQGMSFIRMRTSEARGQTTLGLTAEDAETVLQLRRDQGFNLNGARQVIASSDVGVFYVVQLIPDLAPNRVKLGFTNHLQSRLDAHHTAAPTAIVTHAWPCRRSWEIAALASITRTGCTLLANEVFTCDDITALVERGHAFFSLMPHTP